MINYFDGGMGTMLRLKAGELPEQLNITDPERVFAVHRAYAEAGADFIAVCFGFGPSDPGYWQKFHPAAIVN